MALIRFVLWTIICVCAGFYVAMTDWRSARIARKVLVRINPPSVSKLVDLEEARAAILEELAEKPESLRERTRPMPKERYDTKDRQAIEKLIESRR